MKKFSVKTRITLWYTGFMVVLVSISLFCLLLVSGRISKRKTEESLRNVVTDTVSDVRFRHGEADIDDIDFYKDGVSVFLYDTGGHLLAPKVNLGIQVDSVLQDQQLRTVKSRSGDRMVYDVYAVQDDTAFWVRGISSVAEASNAYRTLNLFILVTFPLFIIISAIGGRRITESAFKPVKEMAATAERISSGDHLSERVQVPETGDEISRLAATVNAMFEKLSRSFEKEKQFTSDVSHELRTPLAAIKARCEYALSQDAKASEKDEALYAIYRQSQRMSKMTEQLLMLTRADKGTLKFDRKPVDMTRLIKNVCDDVLPAAEVRNISLKSEAERDIFVTGDETLLTRLVTNLISNAIKYNKEGGRVSVSLTSVPPASVPQDSPGLCTLTVEDTGTGIKEEELPKIWDRFYRAEAARSSEGTGLGLSMVKYIAKLHNAEIKAESKYGKGSRFTVVFKKKPQEE